MAPAYTAAEFQGEHPSVPTHSPVTLPQFLEGISKRFLIDLQKKKKKNRTIPISFFSCWYFTITGAMGALGQEFCSARAALWCPPSHKQSRGRLCSIQVLCMRTMWPSYSSSRSCTLLYKEIRTVRISCTQNASEAGFLPRINLREITEAGVLARGLLKLLKSEKSPGMMKIVLDSVVCGSDWVQRIETGMREELRF